MDRRRFVAGGAAALGAAALPLERGPGRSWPAGPGAVRVLPRAAADDARMAWWREARFGLFLHWGLYSILAGEYLGRSDYAEWIRYEAHIPVGTYRRLAARFNPVKFDADQWVAMAKDAGMKYVTITTKHHDGFCLFDNRLTEFCVRATPYRRDVMRQMADACRGAGLTPCWYHSIMDWNHPDYVPRRDWEAATRRLDGASYTRFVRYLHGSVEQLLKDYGDIGVLWFDGNWEQTWTHELGRALYQACRGFQPSVIVNNRLEGWSQAPITDPLGDFRTPEQEVPATGWPGVDWESCITMNDHWGYNAHDHNFKSLAQLVGLLVETASKGGNLLLNVGPKADGTFPDESVDRLAAMGRWMQVNGEAIYGTSASLFANASFRSTTKGKRLYLFFTGWPNGAVRLPGLTTRIRRAWLLARPDLHATVLVPDSGGQALMLPLPAPDPVCSVVVLDFDETPAVQAADTSG